ncbi:Uncharacterised protein [Mycobacteroides abscessus subsp. abscessus]|nr:Uncharacterised protein [Mycobacteroides abscessus subsp. abscessus]
MILPSAISMVMTTSSALPAYTATAGAAFAITISVRLSAIPFRNGPAKMRASFPAPVSGRRAAPARPLPSAIQVASGARSAIRPSTSPVSVASRNCSAIRVLSLASRGSNRLRRACTCSRARCAICRTVVADLLTAPAISS